jgi:hypothetical protein
VAITKAALKMIAATKRLWLRHQLPALHQWHLRWQVIALKHLDIFALVAKTDIFSTSIPTRAKQPEVGHQYGVSFDKILAN